MRDLVAKIILTLFGLAAFVAARGAEKVVFEANSPLAVAAGEPFRMEFALNAKPDEDSFAAPAFDGFDVLAGPAVSRGSSIQIVNGSMTKSVNYTITYVLLPRAAGNVTVGAAEIAVDGTTYRTEPVLIEVIDEAAGSGAGTGPTDGRPGRRSTRANRCAWSSSSTSGWTSWGSNPSGSLRSTGSGRRS